MPPTIPRPLPPDAIARLRSVAGVCDVLRGWGRPELADRIAYFASDEDLDDGDVPVTLESARGFLAFFGVVETEGKVEIGCSPEGWICAEWDFPDRRDAGLWFLDGERVMFSIRDFEGLFMEIDSGNRVCSQARITEKLVELELFTWHTGDRAATNSLPVTT